MEEQGDVVYVTVSYRRGWQSHTWCCPRGHATLVHHDTQVTDSLFSWFTYSVDNTFPHQYYTSVLHYTIMKESISDMYYSWRKPVHAKNTKKITSNNYTTMDHNENTQIRGAQGGKEFLYHTILYHTNSLTLAQWIPWTGSENSWFRPNDCAVICCVVSSRQIMVSIIYTHTLLHSSFYSIFIDKIIWIFQQLKWY